jgi:predicted TIM-barrel fold metal-dependent hydrolase
MDRSDLFWEVGGIDYPIVDADAHVNEPPDLWLDRVPARWRQRAPRVERTDRGDAWVFDDGKLQMHVGLTAVAGKSVLDYSNAGASYEQMRPGSWDAKARLADMDIDGIWGQVMYPSITLTGARVYGDDPELQHACVRAYNEWMLEFCEGSGGRLIPQAIIPACGTERAIEELEWAIANGHRGAIISSFPNGSLDHTPDDDRFFATAQEADFPVAVHIGSFSPNIKNRSADWNDLQFIGLAIAPRCGGGVIEATLALIFSGIFEKFPRLKMLLVEANIAWVPGLLEQSDDMFQRYDALTHLPAELLGELHARQRRARDAPPHEHRAPDVQHRLPAQRHRLARLAPHDREAVPRPPEGPGPAHAAGQRRRSVRPEGGP